MSKQKIINPATGEVLAEISQLVKQEVEAAIQTARQAFDRGPWAKISLAERKNFLLKISQGILDHAYELAQLETKNTGKPIKESTFMDIPSSAKTFEYFANNLEHYLKGKKIELDSKAESQLLYEPRGVVVLIVPWNYPFLIASWKMAQALAAGNTVILKPSSLTPLTALKLAEIVSEAGLPEGVVNVVNASGIEVGSALCSDNRIDMISFTGSTETGKEIMNFASKNPKKLIMELGGKSASIILADCDIETAVSGALSSVFLNQGQMCTAMSRILIDKRISERFKERFIKKAKKIKLGNGLDPETQMGPLISEEHRQKVISYVEKAKIEGARVLCGGEISGKPELKNGFFFEPTVFGQVDPEMSVFQQEIFGPVVCISEFSQEEEGIKLANDSSFGLACSIWSNDLEKARNLSKEINAGTIWINTYGMFYNAAPYGGFKQSGFGKELGEEGFLEYTRLKHVNYDISGEKPLVASWYAL
ncbi:MAG: aldehyde dehydrogenase family protein [Candidatus Omnitrophota bacterium]|nr:aldehyde dehydrogenase family protein [Candidatus Omnitrophota bacterium]